MNTTTESTTDEEYRARAVALAKMLRARPERHLQRDWIRPAPKNECGTAACVAGWAALWSVGKVDIAPDGEMTWAPTALQLHHAYGEADPGWGKVAPTLYDPELYESAFRIGREWLGLPPNVAWLLFYRPPTNEVAIETLEDIAEGRLSRLAGTAETSRYLNEHPV